MKILSAICAAALLITPARAQVVQPVDAATAAEALRIVLATEYAGYDVALLATNDLTIRLASSLQARSLPFADVVRCNNRGICRLHGGVTGAIIVSDIRRDGADVIVTLTHWREGEFRAFATDERHTLTTQAGELRYVKRESLRES